MKRHHILAIGVIAALGGCASKPAINVATPAPVPAPRSHKCRPPVVVGKGDLTTDQIVADWARDRASLAACK